MCLDGYVLGIKFCFLVQTNDELKMRHCVGEKIETQQAWKKTLNEKKNEDKYVKLIRQMKSRT